MGTGSLCVPLTLGLPSPSHINRTMATPPYSAPPHLSVCPSPPLSFGLPIAVNLSVPHLPCPIYLFGNPTACNLPTLTSSIYFLACRSSGELMGGGWLRPKLWGMMV